MTHLSRDMARARENCPQYTGLARDIREALSRSHEPLSVDRLRLVLGQAKPDKIRAALSGMISTGGIVSNRGPKGVTYELYKPPEKKTGSGQIAGQITIPQFRYGSTRLG